MKAAGHESEERRDVGEGEPRRQTERKPYTPPKVTRHGSILAQTADPTVDAAFSGVQSDRALKEGVAPIDAGRVLAGVAALPISTWSYRGEGVRHLGPMAQDFSTAFGLGGDERWIQVVDASGVALAAIQGLHAVVQVQAAQLAALERELATLNAELDARDVGTRDGLGVA